MGRKDLTGKDYFAEWERFAELLNFTFYEGKKVVQKEDLSRVVRVYPSLRGTGHFEGRKRLLELFDVPVKTAAMLKGKIPDYDFPLLEADYINPDYFQTDLKEFFQAMQCRGNKEKLNALFHSESFLRLKEDAARAIAAHLGWKRLTIKAAKEKEGFVLCKALEELMEDARTAGRREGQASGMSKGERKGKKEERISIIRNMQREGMDRALIVKLTGCTSKEFALAAER